MARRSRRTSSSNRGRQTPRIGQNAPFFADAIGLAGSLLRSQQQAGAEKIAALAGAARGFADEMEDLPHLNSYASAAADQMSALASYAASTPLEDMLEDGMAFARRYPLATAAFAVAAGYAFTRMMAGETRQRSRNRSAASQGQRRPSGRSRRRTTPVKARGNGSDPSHGLSHAA